MKKLGLFGGTFNPIHLGHLRAAEEVKEAFELDKILFIPSYTPPHKEKDSVAPALHRLEMVRRSIRQCPGLAVSDFEALREKPSYTFDTLLHFQNLYPNMERFFILGIDAFLEIHTWWRFPQHFSHAHFIVISRPGGGAETLQAYIPSRLASVLSPQGDHWTTQDGFCLFYFTCSGLDISGSQIRQAVRNGKSIRFLVPNNVRNYLYSHKLYQ